MEHQVTRGVARIFWEGEGAGYKFLLHNTTVLYTSSLTSSAAISAQNNFQELIFFRGGIYRYTPVATALYVILQNWDSNEQTTPNSLPHC